jgi:hypothetical protein
MLWPHLGDAHNSQPNVLGPDVFDSVEPAAAVRGVAFGLEQQCRARRLAPISGYGSPRLRQVPGSRTDGELPGTYSRVATQSLGEDLPVRTILEVQRTERCFFISSPVRRR